jgi:hypothetical protein
MGECIAYANNTNREFVETLQQEWAHKWPNKVMYYDIKDSCRTLSDKQVKKAFNLAMTTWDLEIDIKFKSLWGNRDGITKANLKVEFKSSDEDDHFAAKPSVLAYAYFPGQGSVSGKVVFNDDYIWSMNGEPILAKDAIDKGWINPETPPGNMIRTYNIITVLIHELGHSLGLRHDVTGRSDGRDVMDAFYDGALDLSERDILRILLKYPRRVYSRSTHYGRLKKWLARKKARL